MYHVHTARLQVNIHVHAGLSSTIFAMLHVDVAPLTVAVGFEMDTLAALL
jgi:hypothetical protein